jgi:hypothetical protein
LGLFSFGRAPTRACSRYAGGARWLPIRMDARRRALARVVPLPSSTTPQTPDWVPTRREGGKSDAWRRCSFLAGSNPAASVAPCPASDLPPSRPSA